MSRYLIDTHVFVWWLLDPQKLSKRTLALLSRDDAQFWVCTISLLEMQYLIEIDRIQMEMQHVLAYLDRTENFALLPFNQLELIHAVNLRGTRDPFDRIIMASAVAHEIPLITKDRWMRREFAKQTVW